MSDNITEDKNSQDAWSVPSEDAISDTVAPPMSPISAPSVTVPVSNSMNSHAVLPTEPLSDPAKTATVAPANAVVAPSDGPALITNQIPPIATSINKPAGSGKFVKVILTIIILVVVFSALLVGGVLADDKGWVNTGLSAKLSSLNISNFWGGLSANPSAASIQLEAAMKQQTNTAYIGKLVGYGSGSQSGASSGSIASPAPSYNPTASPLPTASPSLLPSSTPVPSPASSSAPPLGISTSPAGASELLSTNTSNVVANNVTDPLSLSYNYVLAGSGQNFDLAYSSASATNATASGGYRVVGGVAYAKVVETSTILSSGTVLNTRSAAIDAAVESWKKAGTLSASPDLLISLIAKKVANGQFVAAETIGSNRTYHFKSTISGSDIPLFSIMLPTEVAKLWQASNGSVDVWISRSTNSLIKLSLDLTRSSDKNKITFDALYDKSQVKNEIKIPENIVDEVVTPKTPDEQRKADLLTIAAALEKYKTAKGSYPISNGRERTDQLTSVLQLNLIPTYITKIPADSVVTKYYDYSSDGVTYELSAVLDSTTDTGGVMVGNKMIYTIKGPVAAASSSSAATSPSPLPGQ